MGHNTHTSISHTYSIESDSEKKKGRYMDINGNKATAYGLMAAAERAGKSVNGYIKEAIEEKMERDKQ